MGVESAERIKRQEHAGRTEGRPAATADRRTRTSDGFEKKGLMAALGVGMAVTALIGVDQWNRKNDRIVTLEESNEHLDTMIDTTLTLGRAGIRFSDVSLSEEGHVIVEVPGTSANCQSISFEFDSTAEGWTLNFDQTDAAGRTYDSPEAHDAASVTALVEDLCS